ncbi:MAG TPA: hypothetical protein PLF26_20110 [Blastocatellia bacterium]|nr:hypothetical protein [Blastocatellia bacterium]
MTLIELDPNDPALAVIETVRRAALVFYAEDRWKPFPADSPESRVTKPDAGTHVQFNHLPGRHPHAEYRGPLGRWWVRIDPASGMPTETPTFVPSAGATSSAIN